MAIKGQRILVVENGTGPVIRPGFMVDPSPPGHSDQLVVYFTTFGPVTAYSTESSSDTTGTWRADPDYPEGVTAASLTTDVAAKADAGDLSALDDVVADGALYTAALAQIRDRYPDHWHGLLGLNGDPQGTDGELDYTLPGDS
jgi:hypothetical protein